MHFVTFIRVSIRPITRPRKSECLRDTKSPALAFCIICKPMLLTNICRGHNLFVGKKTGDKDAEVAADPGLKTTNLQSSSWATSARADPHRTTSLRAHHWSRSTMGRLSTFCDSGRSSKSLPPGGGDKCGPSNSPGSKRKSFFSKTKFGSKRNLPPSTGFSKDIIYTKKNGATSFFPESP